jgi:phosphoribosylformylglycinamidine (FGAM) synthase PurS component
MLRMGPPSGEIRSMTVQDIFLSRLKLLIIMAKAYIEGCPVGKYRKKAVIGNAQYIFYHSLQMVNEMTYFMDRNIKAPPGIAFKDAIHKELIFHQRIQMLAIMAKAFAEHRLKGRFRKEALRKNLNRICEALIFNFNIEDVKFLKVA